MQRKIFRKPQFALQSGATLHDALLVYGIAGSVNEAGNNVIVYPTSYGSRDIDIAWLVGPGRPLDTDRYCVIVPNMLGNGVSSSPSHRAPGTFPALTVGDSVRLQHSLLHDELGIERIALVVGFSMGGQQAYHWAAWYPREVDRAAMICASAKTSVHNGVFLEGLKAALTLDPSWNGHYFSDAALQGVRAMARVYAGWGLSAEFYRQGLYLQAGYRDVEDFIVRDWEAWLRRTNPNDLLAMLCAWQGADISLHPSYGGVLSTAMAAIEAQCLIMPSVTDMYFSSKHIADEAKAIRQADICPIDTVWGHRVNNPVQNPTDAAFVERKLRDLLNTPVSLPAVHGIR